MNLAMTEVKCDIEACLSAADDHIGSNAHRNKHHHHHKHHHNHHKHHHRKHQNQETKDSVCKGGKELAGGLSSPENDSPAAIHAAPWLEDSSDMQPRRPPMSTTPAEKKRAGAKEGRDEVEMKTGVENKDKCPKQGEFACAYHEDASCRQEPLSKQDSLNEQNGFRGSSNISRSMAPTIHVQHGIHDIPGAFAVSGVDREQRPDTPTIDPTIDTMSIPRSLEPISAEAVDVEADNRRFYKRLERELRTRLAERERNTAVAEVVDLPVWLSSPRVRRWIIIGAVLLICTIILAVVLTLVLKPPPEPPDLVDFLASISFDGGVAVRTSSTPQNDAMNWLSTDPLLANYSDSKKSQRYALATLFFSTRGDSWSDNEGWLSDDDECLWHNEANVNGAGCSEAGSFMRLALSSNNLNGTIPEEIALLSDSLEVLHLHQNYLSGTLPSTIGYLVDLKSFWLYENSLTGGIPSEIGLMTDLEKLWLSKNELTNTIPNSIGSLTNLVLLDFGSNHINGSIPSAVGLMTNLKDKLVFGSNELVGKIPSSISELTNLEYLDLSHNALSGTLPTFIGWLTSLEQLHLDNNTLTGTIPTQMAWMRSLVRLYFPQNNLIGPIPTELGELSLLRQLWLWENDLTGVIPNELGLLADMRDLEIYSNTLTGALPEDIFSLTRLTRLDVQWCTLTGTLSTKVGQLLYLEQLRVSRNQMTGTIPNELGNLSRLEQVWVHGNRFSGPVPRGLCGLRPAPLVELTADCLPVETPPQLCLCCTHCCERESKVCLATED